MMNARLFRNIAVITFCVAVLLFIIDTVFVFDDSWFNGTGIISTFVLTPVGILSGVLAYRKTESRIDGLLIFANISALFIYFAFMFIGTLLLGP
ncbi:hypothetical protein [Paenibacillus phytohabitans]|uniref:hypothetical protein n=1 Tax=Paenibacillus phytohabitans TaxID=2654978 RepID=UPI003008B3B2